MSANGIGCEKKNQTTGKYLGIVRLGIVRKWNHVFTSRGVVVRIVFSPTDKLFILTAKGIGW